MPVTRFLSTNMSASMQFSMRFWTERSRNRPLSARATGARRLVAAVCAIFVIACGSRPVEGIAGDADDAARVIAGFPSSLNKFGKAENGSWRSYAQETSAYWSEYERGIGRAMRKWGCLELDRAEGATVFYPFSGPDLPSVYQLFPEAGRYVLVSMQKAEAPPRLENFSEEELENYLAAFRKAWKFFGALGFFRTEDLEAVEKGRGMRMGMTGPLMAFAVRLGFEIESVEPIRLDTGSNDVVPSKGNPAAADRWDSTRLTLRKNGRRVIVDFVSMDLRDGWLVQLPGAHGWIDRMSENPTLLKAASHLPQDSDFSILRNSVVWNAPSVVQDETGIDYGALAKEFAVRLYGKFTRPNRSFNQELQRDLAAAYRSSWPAANALPFRFGYEKHAGSSMQVAIRKTNAVQLPRKCVQSASH
jgi:hypothetical protein